MAEPDETQKTAPEVSENTQPETPVADNDPQIDHAVDDIVRKESDDELKAQDEAAEQSVTLKQGHKGRLKQFWRNWWGDPRKRWGTIAAVLVVIVALFVVPFTRYEILGLFVREKITVRAIDSKSGVPVSGVQVIIGGEKAETDAEGVALLHVHTGSRQLQVSKKYYKGSTEAVLVTMSASHNVYKAKLVALGRQVKVKLVDKISSKPLTNAEVKVGGASTKTDKDGMANVVLPSGVVTKQARVTLGGYNAATVIVDANGNLAKNTFAVTPSGKLYFLSNLSGTIDVVKTNLDGTDRQTVLAGTGNEDPHSTSLLASRDWKYLALLSKRAGNSASLYLIDTTNGDKLTTIDQGSAIFTPVGWSDDQFVYEVDRSATIKDWQSNQEALKGFDPNTGHTLLLDQTQASGTGLQDWVGQSFGQFYLIGTKVVYTKGWGSGYAVYQQINSKHAELDSINADGTNHQTIRTFSVGSSIQTSYVALGTKLYEPNSLYLYWSNADGGDQFYTYENGKVTQNTSMSLDDYNNASYSTYLLSPSANITFWTEERDGKNTLFTGNENGENKQQVASLSDYSPYGWYTDKYLLVSKNSSELYAMPVGGGTPLKITDYYKPPINYNGYGGGYGGL